MADMPTWEYLTTPLMIHNTTAILNTWGAQGWELVKIITDQAIHGGKDGHLLVFKRQSAA